MCKGKEVGDSFNLFLALCTIQGNKKITLNCYLLYPLFYAILSGIF